MKLRWLWISLLFSFSLAASNLPFEKIVIFLLIKKCMKTSHHFSTIWCKKKGTLNLCFLNHIKLRKHTLNFTLTRTLFTSIRFSRKLSIACTSDGSEIRCTSDGSIRVISNKCEGLPRNPFPLIIGNFFKGFGCYDSSWLPLFQAFLCCSVRCRAEEEFKGGKSNAWTKKCSLVCSVRPLRNPTLDKPAIITRAMRVSPVGADSHTMLR